MPERQKPHGYSLNMRQGRSLGSRADVPPFRIQSLAPQSKGKLHRVAMFERIEILAAVICDTKQEVGHGVEQEAGGYQLPVTPPVAEPLAQRIVKAEADGLIAALAKRIFEKAGQIESKPCIFRSADQLGFFPRITDRDMVRYARQAPAKFQKCLRNCPSNMIAGQGDVRRKPRGNRPSVRIQTRIGQIARIERQGVGRGAAIPAFDSRRARLQESRELEAEVQIVV